MSPPNPDYSSLFQSIPYYSSPFQHITAYYSLFKPIQAYCFSIFLHIPANKSLFQLIPALFQPISSYFLLSKKSAYSSIFKPIAPYSTQFQSFPAYSSIFQPYSSPILALFQPSTFSEPSTCPSSLAVH